MGNARDIGITVETTSVVSKQEIAIKEEMTYLTHAISEKNITIITRLYNSVGDVVKEDTIIVSGSDYDLLMSDDIDVFGDNKEKGKFNDDDIWIIVDMLRGN